MSDLFCSHCGYHICRCTAIPKIKTTEADCQGMEITHRLEIPAPTETEGVIVIFSIGGTLTMQARNLSKVDLAACFSKLMKELR